jgi:hypothetical protein
MEKLLNNIKNDVISHQTFIRKTRHKKMEWLKKVLTELKNDYNANVDRIQTAEKELNQLADSDLRAELEKFRHYDILHTEKMTPRFLSITKQSKKPTL